MTTDLVLGRGLKEISVTMEMLLMGNLSPSIDIRIDELYHLFSVFIGKKMSFLGFTRNQLHLISKLKRKQGYFNP